MKYRSIQSTALPPEGWMKKPNSTDNNADIKLMIWNVKLNMWLNFIYN